MSIAEEKSGEVVVLRPEGMIHNEGARVLLEKIAEVIERGERHLLLDFTDVRYINSSGLNALIQTETKLAPAGGKLVLAGVSEPVHRILKIAGLTSTLKVFSTKLEALASFA